MSRPAVEGLNAASPFLFTADELQSYGRLGDKVAAVFNAGGEQTYGPVVIGSGKWAEPIAEGSRRHD